MTDTVTKPETTTSSTRVLPQRLHHTARVVKNQEVTRQYYEDLLGMPLVATWTENNEFPGVGKVSFCHTFFGLADGSALAFFQFAKPEVHEVFKAKTQTGFNHLALAVSREDQDSIRERLEAAGRSVVTIDHGYCLSIYTTDPDELNLEFTSDPSNATDIDRNQRKNAHATLARWLDGDLTVNNDLQP